MEKGDIIMICLAESRFDRGALIISDVYKEHAQHFIFSCGAVNKLLILGSVAGRKLWLKLPEMVTNTLGCCVYILAATDLIK